MPPTLPSSPKMWLEKWYRCHSLIHCILRFCSRFLTVRKATTSMIMPYETSWWWNLATMRSLILLRGRTAPPCFIQGRTPPVTSSLWRSLVTTRVRRWRCCWGRTHSEYGQGEIALGLQTPWQQRTIATLHFFVEYLLCARLWVWLVCTGAHLFIVSPSVFGEMGIIFASWIPMDAL